MAAPRKSTAIKELREQLEKMDLGPAMKAKMEEYLERRLKALEDIIRRYVRMEREKRDIRQREDQRMNQIGGKGFYYLGEDELKKMQEAVQRPAQIVRDVVGHLPHSGQQPLDLVEHRVDVGRELFGLGGFELQVRQAAHRLRLEQRIVGREVEEQPIALDRLRLALGAEDLRLAQTILTSRGAQA